MRMRSSAAGLGLALALAACSGGGSAGGPGGGGGGTCTYGYKPLACWSYPEGTVTLAARTPISFVSCSYSYEGQPLSLSWALEARPATSTAATFTSSGGTATLVADVAGDYTVAITATDRCGSSTSRHTFAPLEFAPWADAGTAQVAAIGDDVALDGTGSSDLNLDPLAYAWTITAAPDGSAAALTGADTAAPHLVPDVPGTYELTLEVADGRSTPDTSVVRVDAYHPAVAVAVQPWDVEYSAALDRLVALEDGGSSLWVVDPHDGATTEVALSAVGYAVAVSPDGSHAAVSHDRLLSWVDLSTGSVAEYATGSDGGDVVLPGNGDACVFPRLDYMTEIRVVSLDPAQPYDGRMGSYSAEAGPARKPRYTAARNRLYAIRGDRNAFDSFYLGQAYRTTVNYRGMTEDYRAKGNGPWLSEDGARVYVGSGDVYQPDSYTTAMTLLGGTLKLSSDASGLRWIADSATGGILVVPEYGTSHLTDAPVRLHDRATFAAVREHAAPVVFGAGGIERGTPVFAFWKADGSGFYVVTRQWSGTGMAVAEY